MRLFAGFGRMQVLIAIYFCIPVQLAHLLYMMLENKSIAPWLLAFWLFMSFAFALLGVACAVATDNLLGDSVRMAARLVAAMLLAALAMTLVSEVLYWVLPAAFIHEAEEQFAGQYVNAFHRTLFHFITSGDTAMLLIPLYMMVQASRRATKRLHEARMQALAAERHVVEADLRAMQARVEPDLLFAALGAVDHAYAQSVDAGEHALDALIAYLRAALPAEPGSTSTVAAELDLVRAYVGVMELLSGPKLELDIAAEPAARAQPMPAMLLLPLARWALDGAPGAALQLGARRTNGVLELSVKSDLATATTAQTGEVAGVRERLEHLYGERARFEASAEPLMRRALIALPA